MQTVFDGDAQLQPPMDDFSVHKTCRRNHSDYLEST